MSDTEKQGKRSRMPSMRPEFPGARDAVTSRHSFGRSEKILRRNRKTWTRLLNKQRRAHGKQETQDSE